MAEPASTSAAITAIATSSVLIAFAETWVDPWNPRMAVGVLCGSMIFLLRTREEHWWRRLIYSILSLLLGYITASWLSELFPRVPVGLAGFSCAALIVGVATAVFDWANKQLPIVVDRLAMPIVDWLAGFINKGGSNRDHD